MGVHGQPYLVLQGLVVVDSHSRAAPLGLALGGCLPQMGRKTAQILLVPPDSFPSRPPSRQL